MEADNQHIDISDEDECFLELDVYVKNTGDNLHLFQYPLRPSDRPYGDGNNHLKDVSVKREK